jgi:phosphopantothenoylcysteine synthetase/decarboxylase
VTRGFDGLTLTIVVCAAGPAGQVLHLVTDAQDHGWTVDLVATPTAVDFLDLEPLALAIGQPVRTSPRPNAAGTSRRSSAPAATIVAPATFNTINKLAAGISDNYALTTVAEAIGHGVPTVLVPFVNTAFARRAPFTRSIAQLRDEGIRVIYGRDDAWEPHEPGTGDLRIPLFPWSTALREAEHLAAKPDRLNPLSDHHHG